MDVVAAVEQRPQPQPAELVQQRDGLLHHAAMPRAESAMRCPSLSYPRSPRTRLGTRSGAPAPAAHGRDRVDQGQQLGHVVDVAGGEDGGERNAPRVHDQVVLAAGPAAVNWATSLSVSREELFHRSFHLKFPSLTPRYCF